MKLLTWTLFLCISLGSACAMQQLMLSDLPCSVDLCQGSAIPVATLKESLKNLVQQFVASGKLSLLKAATLSEFLYSSFDSVSSNQMKCVEDQSYERGVNVLLALAPPPMPQAQSMYMRVQNTIKLVMFNMFGSRSAAQAKTGASLSAGDASLAEMESQRWTTAECYTHLPGNDEVCEVLACALYSSFTLNVVFDKYLQCCQSYYGPFWPIYCG